MAASLDALVQQRDQLQGLAAGEADAAADAGTETERLRAALENEQRVGADALGRVALLNQQLRALRRQMAALEEALDASEVRDRESQTALRSRPAPQRCARPARSDPVALPLRLLRPAARDPRRSRRDRSGRRPLCVQSEVLFPSGSETLNAEGRQELDRLATELITLDAEIPDDIDWVLRVDGHTDARPVSGGRFRSNWDLSAARAISVVQYLIARACRPRGWWPPGFGEFRPLVDEASDEAYQRNRRIELKLTER
jgi:chemotaxis protein MotB